MDKEKKVEKAAGVDPAAAAPSQPAPPRRQPLRVGIPSTPLGRFNRPNQPSGLLKRLTSWQGGLAGRCRRRIDPRCFLEFLLFLSSSFSVNILFHFRQKALIDQRDKLERC